MNNISADRGRGIGTSQVSLKNFSGLARKKNLEKNVEVPVTEAVLFCIREC